MPGKFVCWGVHFTQGFRGNFRASYLNIERLHLETGKFVMLAGEVSWAHSFSSMALQPGEGESRQKPETSVCVWEYIFSAAWRIYVCRAGMPANA